MRYFRFCIFLSILVLASCIFLPYIKINVRTFSFGQQRNLSLYNAFNEYSIAEKFIDNPRANQAEQVANALLRILGKKVRHLRKHLENTKATLEDVQEIQDTVDLKNNGPKVRIASMFFLALLAILTWLVLQSIAQQHRNNRRTRLIACLCAAISVVTMGLILTVKEGLSLANEELGGKLLILSSGAYLMVLASLLAFISSVAIVIIEKRKEAFIQ